MSSRFDQPDFDMPPVHSHGAAEKSSFEYLAMDDNGRELRGQIRAADDIEAVAKLRKQHLFPIEVWRSKHALPGTHSKTDKKKEQATPAQKAQRAKAKRTVAHTHSKGDSFLKRMGLGHVLKPKILAMFTRQLATMLEAGLPLLLSLRTLNEQCGKHYRYRSLKVITGDLARKVESGMAFSEALELYDRSFNKLYIGLVRAGEASGSLEEVLVKLAEYIEKTERLKKKIKAGMTYPVVVLVIACTITLGLMIGVVPKFAEMFDEILEGIPLPLLTQWVIAISNGLMHNIMFLIGGLFVGMIAFRIFLATKVGKNVFHWYLLTMPPLNILVGKIAIARFCSTLGTLLDSGVPILDALLIVQNASTNEVVSRNIGRVHQAVSGGEKLVTPMEATKIFPTMVVRMIEVGEQTGSLPDMLKRIGRNFEEEVEMTLEALISLIEPFMICFLAIVIGSIVLALFLPLIKIIETLGV